MKILLVIYLAMLMVSCSSVGRTTRQEPSINSSVSQNEPQKSTMTERETAVSVARERAMSAYGSLDRYIITPCEQEAFWRIFLEPKNPSFGREGVEYVISKRGGQIISQRELPLSAKSNVNDEESSSKSASITREEALAIAKKDAVTAYGSLDPYVVTVCELSTVWSVIYSPKEGLNGGGPEYVIDKKTGRFIDKKYYQ